MTEAQYSSIPLLLKRKDVLVKSQTGSGKTLAYAIPIVQTLQQISPKIDRTSGILALVIVPTRELVLQTYTWFVKILKPFTWVVASYLMGGEKKKSEKARIRKGVNILVSTPGRLLDHLSSTKNLNLGRLQWLVLDEADRLLDLGYEKDVAKYAVYFQWQSHAKLSFLLLVFCWGSIISRKLNWTHSSFFQDTWLGVWTLWKRRRNRSTTDSHVVRHFKRRSGEIGRIDVEQSRVGQHERRGRHWKQRCSTETVGHTNNFETVVHYRTRQASIGLAGRLHFVEIHSNFIIPIFIPINLHHIGLFKPSFFENFPPFDEFFLVQFVSICNFTWNLFSIFLKISYWGHFDWFLFPLKVLLSFVLF